MAWAKMTLIGIQNYLQAEGEDVFKNLSFPDGIDKETATDTIFMMDGEYPMLWANPYFVQEMIGIWSSKMQRTFERWQIALDKEDYNPTHNYDRYEEWTDTEKANSKSSADNTHSVTGYDSDTLRTNDADKGSTSADANRDGSHKGHTYGNIGVMTAMQTIREEVELRQDYNLYNLIADAFRQEFCILVY